VRVCVCVFSLKEIIVLYKKAQQNLNSVWGAGGLA
jgi:hypothetical protein